MLYNWLALASWSALVLLIMPERNIGLIQTAVLLVLGIVCILWRKPKLQRKRPEKWSLSFSCGFAGVVDGNAKGSEKNLS